MLKKTKAIILYAVKYNDSAQIIHAYTQECGRMAFWLRLPKSKKTRVKSVLFKPLSLLDMEIEVKPKGGLSHIKEATVDKPLASIPFHPVKISLALFLAEYLGKVLGAEEKDEALYAYLEYSIQWLDACNLVPANFHLVFLMHFSRFLGLYPNLENYQKGDFFDLENGCFVSSQPFHGHFIKGMQAKHILTLMRMNYENMYMFKMNKGDRNEILKIIIQYYEIHIPSCKDFKSLPVLQGLFD